MTNQDDRVAFLMAQFTAEAQSYYWALSNQGSVQFIADRRMRMGEIGKALNVLVGEKEAARLVLCAMDRAEIAQAIADLQNVRSYFERYRQ